MYSQYFNQNPQVMFASNYVQTRPVCRISYISPALFPLMSLFTLHPLSSWVCESIAQTPQNNQAMSRWPDTSVLFSGVNILGNPTISRIFLCSKDSVFRRGVVAQQSGMSKWSGEKVVKGLCFLGYSSGGKPQWLTSSGESCWFYFWYSCCYCFGTRAPGTKINPE